jgi:hypothetical protein
LCSDFDLMLIAFARDAALTSISLPRQSSLSVGEVFLQFAAQVREILEAQRGGFYQFMCRFGLRPSLHSQTLRLPHTEHCLMQKSSSQQGGGEDDCIPQLSKPFVTCHLPMLNQGNETTLNYKKLITEYADVALGMRLRLP